MNYIKNCYYRRGDSGFVFKVIDNLGSCITVEIVSGSEEAINSYVWEQNTSCCSNPSSYFDKPKAKGDIITIYPDLNDVELTENELIFEVI